jgi:hypothetical protein
LFNNITEIGVLVPFRSAPGDGSIGPENIFGATGSSAGRLAGTKILSAVKLLGLGTDEFIAI